jgi:Holliday junction resolvase RusA-like endonuclease
MRGDLDNRIKPTQDLLVKGGVLPDDRHAASIMAERGTHTEPFVICIIEWSESP